MAPFHAAGGFMHDGDLNCRNQCGIERPMPHHPDYVVETQAWLNGFLLASGNQVLSLGLQAAIVLAKMHETPALQNFIIPATLAPGPAG
jgi:hypothetical protein